MACNWLLDKAKFERAEQLSEIITWLIAAADSFALPEASTSLHESQMSKIPRRRVRFEVVDLRSLCDVPADGSLMGASASGSGI